MSDTDLPASDRRSEPVAAHPVERRTERVLVMRPRSFASLRFDMHVEERQVGPPRSRPPRRGTLDRLMDLNLLLMILLIGVPVLVYCILSSTR